MNGNSPEVVKEPVIKKSVPARPKKIRIIGGPAIKPPPDADFQQVPFTLQGLSEVEGLENADIIVYWPSPDLFDPKVIARELTQHARILDDKSKEKWVLGLKLTRHVVTQDVYGEAYAKELDMVHNSLHMIDQKLIAKGALSLGEIASTAQQELRFFNKTTVVAGLFDRG